MKTLPFTVSKDMSPAIFGQITECIIVTKGSTTIIQGLHAYVGFRWSRGTTACYNCLLLGKLTSSDTVAETLGNWHLIKQWPSSLYRNAWNCHRVESWKTHFDATLVVILEGGDCPRDEWRLRATGPQDGFLPLDEEEDHWHEMVSLNKYIRRCLSVAIPAYRKREGA
jgi:hypothetical protein